MTRFDRLFAEAAPLIRKGLHQPESPPVDGGRWPVSVTLRPDQSLAESLERAMTETELYAGSGHFRTGTASSVHFTVRALERYRETVGEKDEAVTRYARAMSRAARALVRFRYEDDTHGRLMRPEVLATARTGSPG